MRNVINTTVNVTTVANVIRNVRTVLAGVDTCALAPQHSRLYAAPAPQHWLHATGRKPFAGKQKPECMGPMFGGGSDLLSRCRGRESSRCRRPRISSCLARS